MPKCHVGVIVEVIYPLKVLAGFTFFHYDRIFMINLFQNLAVSLNRILRHRRWDRVAKTVLEGTRQHLILDRIHVHNRSKAWGRKDF